MEKHIPKTMEDEMGTGMIAPKMFCEDIAQLAFRTSNPKKAFTNTTKENIIPLIFRQYLCAHKPSPELILSPVRDEP